MSKGKDTGKSMKASDLERSVVELVANVAPWLAPLPTAWLIYERTMVHLQWPWPVALIAGLTLELLGVGILATWLMLYTYNRSKRESDPGAPTWIAGLLVGFYIVTAEALTFALDVWPVAAILAPALFPILSLAAFGLLALRSDHRQRLDAIAKRKQEVKDERQRKREARAQQEAQPEQVPTFITATEHVRWLHDQRPELTNVQLAQEVGCHLSTVGRAIPRNGRNHD